MSDSKSLKFQEVVMTETPKPVSFEIDWTIPNFSFFQWQTGKIESKTRVIGKSSWSLTLHPLDKAAADGSAHPVYDSVGLYVSYSKVGSDTTSAIRAQIKLGVADRSHRFVEGRTTTLDYTFTGSGSYGTHTLVAHSALFSPDATLLVDGSLVVRAEVKFASLSVITPASSEKIPTEDFQQSFRLLYNTDIGRDFVLVSSDGVKTPVHRAVLMSRSPVFFAMFESNMTESRTGLCEISDVDAATLAVLVKYMYCGCSETELDQNTEKILVAADKYQLTVLVSGCEQLLIKSLSKEKLVDLMVLCEKTTSTALKVAVRDYIRMSVNDFRGTGLLKEIFDKASAEFVDDIAQRLMGVIEIPLPRVGEDFDDLEDFKL